MWCRHRGAAHICINGASVILNDIDETLAKNAATEISVYGNCIALAGDASDADFIQSMVDEAVKNFGRVTIAIANAGITLFGDFLNTKQKHYKA